MTSENQRIQSYIDKNRLEVLRIANTDLENCQLDSIKRLLHRLKGTLGTFQFQELASKLQGVYESIEESTNENQLQSAQTDSLALIREQIKQEESRK